MSGRQVPWDMSPQVLLNRSLPAVVAVAYARLGDVAKAREVAAAALSRALDSLHALRDPSPDSFRRWACQLARDRARLLSPWPDLAPVGAWHRELIALRAAGLARADLCSILRMGPERLDRHVHRAQLALQSAIMADGTNGGNAPCQSSDTRPSTSSPGSSGER